MEDVEIVHRFQKNPEEEIRFSLGEYKERRYLDVRLWFLPSSGGDYRPSKKGLTVSMEHLEELKRGLDRAEKAASEMALQQGRQQIK